MTKREKGIKELLNLLEGDCLNVEKAKEESRGISGRGDLTLSFKNRKYSIDVERKSSVPNALLEKDKGKDDILMFRKDRKDWKVYMDLNTLIVLLLNNRS